MSAAIAYRLVIQPSEEDGKFVASFPDIPDLSLEGSDPETVRLEASSKLGRALRGFVSSGKALPPASSGEGDLIEVPHDTMAKLAVVAAFAAAGKPTSDLARRLGIPEGKVRKILDPKEDTDIATLAATLGALGEQLADGPAGSA